MRWTSSWSSSPSSPIGGPNRASRSVPGAPEGARALLGEHVVEPERHEARLVERAHPLAQLPRGQFAWQRIRRRAQPDPDEVVVEAGPARRREDPRVARRVAREERLRARRRGLARERRGACAEQDVVAQPDVEDGRTLADMGDDLGERGEVVRRDRRPADAHAARARLDGAQDQLEERRLSRPRRPDQRDLLARRDLEVDVVEDPHARLRLVADRLEAERAVGGVDHGGLAREGEGGPQRLVFAHAFQRRDVEPPAKHLLHRHVDLVAEGDRHQREADEVGPCDALGDQPAPELELAHAEPGPDQEQQAAHRGLDQRADALEPRAAAAAPRLHVRHAPQRGVQAPVRVGKAEMRAQVRQAIEDLLRGAVQAVVGGRGLREDGPDASVEDEEEQLERRHEEDDQRQEPVAALLEVLQQRDVVWRDPGEQDPSIGGDRRAEHRQPRQRRDLEIRDVADVADDAVAYRRGIAPAEEGRVRAQHGTEQVEAARGAGLLDKTTVQDRVADPQQRVACEAREIEQRDEQDRPEGDRRGIGKEAREGVQDLRRHHRHGDRGEAEQPEQRDAPPIDEAQAMASVPARRRSVVARYPYWRPR